MPKLYAFVLVPFVLTLMAATAWGRTSGGPEIVVVHSGSATLHAMLWRPEGHGPFPGILLNHGSGRTREDLNVSDRTNTMPKNSAPSSPAMVMYSYTYSDAASGFPRTRVLTPST